VPARFAILNPCPKRWSDLTGEGRKRFCQDCQTDVHALDQHHTEEIEILKGESGRLCGYLAGESVSPARSRRAVLVGALLSVVSPLLAQSGRVRFRVSDQTGALVPGAEISLLDKENEVSLTLHADNAGAAVFTGLPWGVARFTVASPGFPTIPVTVTISSGREVKVWATLRFPVVGEVIAVPARKRRGWWIF
jgi:Carboxypeptidase regulatory-like domain